MHQLHCEHLRHDIDHFLQLSGEKMVNKTQTALEMVNKTFFSGENGQYCSLDGR